MARFFVGLRVRLIASDEPLAKNLVGSETSIVGDFVDQYRGDCWELESEWCVPKYAAGWFLEPILPTGHQPAELTVEELLPFLKAREVAA